MKRISVFVVAAVLCCSLPAGVSAEGLLPGLPSFGGWSCIPGHKADCSVAGKLGYLGYNRGMVFNIETLGLPLGDLTNVRHQYAVEGIWLGTSVRCAGPARGVAACDPGDGLCFTLGGSWLFPNNKDEVEVYNENSILKRIWRPTTQWYTLEACASRCSWSNFSLIGGVRYDSFTTNFADPFRAVGIRSRPRDEAGLSLVSYIPYVGAETTWGPVKVRVIGFPWMRGEIQYRETFAGAFHIEASGNYRNSYFLEAFAEWGRLVSSADLSVFALYTMLHTTGEFDLSFSPRGLSQAFAFSIDRQNWIVGGKAVIGFNSPL